MANLTFSDVLKKFVKAQGDTMRWARMASEMALSHFCEHGDVSQLQTFHDAMAKNFARRVAFVTWACTHAPLQFDKTKFSKDKTSPERKLTLADAVKVPFWDFAPEKPVSFFLPADVYEAAVKAVEKFTRGEKNKPADDAASEYINTLLAAIKAVSPLPQDTLPPSSDDDDDDVIEGEGSAPIVPPAAASQHATH